PGLLEVSRQRDCEGADFAGDGPAGGTVIPVLGSFSRSLSRWRDRVSRWRDRVLDSQRMKSFVAGRPSTDSAVSSHSRASFVFKRKADHRVTRRKPLSTNSVSALAAVGLVIP